MFPVTAQTCDWICKEAARNADNRCKLQARKRLHERATIGILCGMFWVSQIGADEPQTARREPMALVHERQRSLPRASPVGNQVKGEGLFILLSSSSGWARAVRN